MGKNPQTWIYEEYCALLFASSKSISTQFQHRGQRQDHLQTPEMMNTWDLVGLKQYSPIHHSVEERVMQKQECGHRAGRMN